MKWPSGRAASALCVAMLAVLPFALFWRVTLGVAAFAEGDLLYYNYPLLRAIAEQWRAGQIPLWNSYIFGGTPLHGNMQGGAFYLPNAMLLVPPTWLTYQYSILLHYSLIGAFTFLFVRALGTGRAAGLVAALVFMLGGFSMGHLGHVTALRAIPWLPLLLYAFERWRQSLDLRHVAVAASAVGIMLLAGHPQVPLYALLVATAYACWCVRGAAQRTRLAGGFLGSFLLGAGLAAIQLLPTAHLARQEYQRPDGHSFAYFVNYSFNPALLVNLVFPRLVPVDEAELAIYVGVATLVLGLVAIWRPPIAQRSLARFFAGLALAALVLAFGGWTPLARPLFHVPLYNLFTAPARNLFAFNFAIAVLAALGVERLNQAADAAGTRLRAVALFVGLLLLAVSAVALVRLAGVPFPAEVARLGEVPWNDPSIVNRLGILAFSLGLLCWHPCGRHAQRAAGTLLVLLLLVDLGSYATVIYTQCPVSDFTAPPRALQFLEAQAEPGRILTLGALDSNSSEAKDTLGPNLNAAFGIESINGWDSLMLRQIDEASGHVMPTYGLILGSGAYSNPQFRRFMDLLNTRLVITLARQAMELPPPRYRQVYDDGDTRIYENTQALPRLFVVPCVRRVEHDGALDALGSGRIDGSLFDLREIALAESAEGSGADDLGDRACAPRATLPGSADVHVLERHPGLLRAAVDSPQRAMLVHSSNYSGGWRAAVDGNDVPVHRVDGLLQGILLPQGHHEVVFVYRPLAFLLGAGVSLLSALAVVALLWRPWQRPRGPETT
jgi:hypothetical protein